MFVATELGLVRAAECRQRAKEILEKAEKIRDRDNRRGLLEIANAWIEQARRWEENPRES